MPNPIKNAAVSENYAQDLARTHELNFDKSKISKEKLWLERGD
ncbi:MAG: hypothetical protein ACP5SE_05045 [Nitrososphaeria archaeon]